MENIFTDELATLVASKALFVANHSGGKDSQAMLIRLLATIPPEQLIVVHASLGEVEWPGALEHAQTQAMDAGLPFFVAKAGKTFFEMVERRFRTRPEVPSWPSASTRQCTSDLKRDPIKKVVRRYAKDHGYTVIVNCLGLRAKESSSRAKRTPFRNNERDSNSVLTWYEWLPIHDIDTAEVFTIIKKANQTPHYAYSLGNDRLSCVFCIMGSNKDLANGAKQNPELLEKYRRLEETTGYTMHMERKPITELAR